MALGCRSGLMMLIVPSVTSVQSSSGQCKGLCVFVFLWVCVSEFVFVNVCLCLCVLCMADCAKCESFRIIQCTIG